MKQLVKIIVFLVLNFGALALGSFLMGGSPAENTWYIELKRAPWTPPGYFFGLAWTTIMILFTVFLVKNFSWNKRFIALLISHYILNIGWNPIFFKLHLLVAGCVVIALLFGTVFSFLFIVEKSKRTSSILLLLPYLLWLFVALSLNLYPLI
jgi:tryptophan-rich sensory protein